jgi:hypothetical protein
MATKIETYIENQQDLNIKIYDNISELDNKIKNLENIIEEKNTQIKKLSNSINYLTNDINNNFVKKSQFDEFVSDLFETNETIETNKTIETDETGETIETEIDEYVLNKATKYVENIKINRTIGNKIMELSNPLEIKLTNTLVNKLIKKNNYELFGGKTVDCGCVINNTIENENETKKLNFKNFIETTIKKHDLKNSEINEFEKNIKNTAINKLKFELFIITEKDVFCQVFDTLKRNLCYINLTGIQKCSCVEFNNNTKCKHILYVLYNILKSKYLVKTEYMYNEIVNLINSNELYDKYEIINTNKKYL